MIIALLYDPEGSNEITSPKAQGPKARGLRGDIFNVSQGPIVHSYCHRVYYMMNKQENINTFYVY